MPSSGRLILFSHARGSIRFSHLPGKVARVPEYGEPIDAETIELARSCFSIRRVHAIERRLVFRRDVVELDTFRAACR
jgi:hypothetical protein